MSSKTRKARKKALEAKREERLTTLLNFFDNTVLEIPEDQRSKDQRDAAEVLEFNEEERAKFLISDDWGKHPQFGIIFVCRRKSSS